MGRHHVRAHTRKDGTPVRGHYQRNPSRGSAGGAGGIIAVALILAILHGMGHQPTAHSARSPQHGQETVHATSHRHTVAQRRNTPCDHCTGTCRNHQPACSG